MKTAIIFTIMLIFLTVAMAQESCDVIVQAAIETTSENCSNLRLNQACYGNVTIDAEAVTDVEHFVFESEGDIVNISDLLSLRLSSQLETNGEWGISIIYLQATLTNTTLEPVSLILFGDVAIENQGIDTAIRLDVIALAGVNIRQYPIDGTIIGSLESGEETVAVARNEGNTWVQVEIPNSSEKGWVAADLIRGDDESLPVVSPNETNFGPMQAFYFRSDTTNSTCSDIPESGILLQTPENSGRIRFRINEVNIELGSTAYLKTLDSQILSISVIEGLGIVESNRVRQFVPAGSYVEVALNSEYLANGSPSFPQAYDENEIVNLPLALLRQQIEPAPPLSPENVQSQIALEESSEESNVSTTRVEVSFQFSILATSIPAGSQGDGVGEIQPGEQGNVIDRTFIGCCNYILVQWDNGILGWNEESFVRYIEN